MIYPYLRLEAPGLDPLVIDLDAGYEGVRLDLGDAVTREVVELAPDADGTVDSTAHIGARNVTLAVNVAPSSGLWAAVRRLKAFTHPRVRPTLYVQQTADAPMQMIGLRRSQWSDPIGEAPRWNGLSEESERPVVVQWVAPLGILESAELHMVQVYAAGTSLSGRTYPVGGRAYPRTYPASTPQGLLSVFHDGTTDAYPVLRLYGPINAGVPAAVTIENVTQGKTIALANIEVAASDYVEIDTRSHTVRRNSDPTLSLYGKLNFAATSWWSLSPGDNLIRFRPATYTVALTAAQIIWRDADL